MRTACIMTQDLFINKDIYMNINTLKLLGKVAVGTLTHTHTHTHTPLHPKILHDLQTTSEKLCNVQTCGQHWKQTMARNGSEVILNTGESYCSARSTLSLLSFEISLDLLSLSLCLSLSLSYSQRSTCEAHRESGQTLLAQQHATEFFLT